MKTLTLEEYRKVLFDRFGGVLHKGCHPPNGKACLLESYAIACGVKWTEFPYTLRIWDLRHLNDMDISPELRAKHLPEVLIAYQNSRDWTSKKQATVASRLAILTVNRIVSKLPGLSDKIKKDCNEAQTCAAARQVVEAVVAVAKAQLVTDAAVEVVEAWPAAAIAAWSVAAAAAAAQAAVAEAWLVADAAAAAVAAWQTTALVEDMDTMFAIACDIFIEAAREEGV